jgi:hypothetical protein
MVLEDMHGSASLPNGINFEGKHYDQSAFNNGVAQYLSAIQVKSVCIRADVSNLKCSGSFYMSYATAGESKGAISCTLSSGSGPFISNLVVTDIATDGIEDLRSFLISSISKENSSNNTVNNNPIINNNNQNNPIQSNNINNLKQPQPSNQSKNSNIIPKRDHDFEHNDQQAIKVNANKATPVPAPAEKTQGNSNIVVGPNNGPIVVPSPNIKIIMKDDLDKLPQRNRTGTTNNTPPQSKVNAQGYDQNGNYIGVGKFDNTTGTINPVGPGKQRADGLYDVKDQSGNVHIISAADNQKLIQRQATQQTAKDMADFQAKQKQQFEQAQKNYQAQLQQQQVQQAQMNAFTDMAAQNIANIATGIGNMIAQAKAKKDADRKRQLMLQQQRQAEEARILAGKNFRRSIRTDLINNFKEGSIPLSTAKVPVDKLYFFVYAYDPGKIELEGMDLYTSNIVEIARASDGTWPYKRTIDEGIEPLTPYKEIFHGYYVSEADAEQALEGFTEMMQKTGVTSHQISFREKKSTLTTNSTQSSKQFWDVNSEVNNKIPVDTTHNTTTSAKKSVDFWGTTDIPTKSVSTAKLEEAILSKNTSQLFELLQSLPEESNDIIVEALRAHALLFTDQAAKAIMVYKKYIGKSFSGSTITWEEKIKKDILYFQSKGIDHQYFPMVQALML